MDLLLACHRAQEPTASYLDQKMLSQHLVLEVGVAAVAQL
jgi:hypothetical protein